LQRVGLAHRLKHYPKHLSGGEQQRVALARAFAPRPGLVLADEPTGNLDAVTGHQVIDLMFAINAESATTLILVTHDEEIAARCRLRMEAGQRAESLEKSCAMHAGCPISFRANHCRRGILCR
jgi:putative ABC transport system ATP-binding protein